jgi:hypothetical protein
MFQSVKCHINFFRCKKRINQNCRSTNFHFVMFPLLYVLLLHLYPTAFIKKSLKFVKRCVICSFKFILAEESIVNAPLASLQIQNTKNAKSEVIFKQLIRDTFTIDSSTPTLRRNLNEHPIYCKM